MRMLDKVLLQCDAVDKEPLCILAGQRVRLSPSLHVPIVVITEGPFSRKGVEAPVDNTFPRGCGKLCTVLAWRV
jgi:hypothetical protein